MSREEHTFPTRSYPYRYPAPPGAPGAQADAVADAIKNLKLESGRLYRFVLGVDERPTKMSDADIDKMLRDPFTQLLLRRGIFPLTLREVLAAFDGVNGEPEGLPQQKSFLVADGGQIPWTPETAHINRLLRFAVVRSRDSDVRVMISASTNLDSSDQFLQLIGWDAANSVFHFFERRGGTWLWAGNSSHALLPDSRGQGPFDSHVNGGMVMKELRAPWSNWHSMRASISDNVLSPTDTLRQEPLFVDRVSAHELEVGVVKPGINRWTQARLAKAISADGSSISDVRFFLRQILDTTTVNLASSDTISAQVTDNSSLTLPNTFFLNVEALLDNVGLEPDISPVKIPGRLYLEALRRYEFVLTDGTFQQPGDTFFAFLIPEPSFEDTNVLAQLLERKVIDPRFAACLLMIDFQNPISSARRRKLMTYVPATARASSAGNNPDDIAHQFVAAIEAVEATLSQESPEREFLANWRLASNVWKRTFETRIEEYFSKLFKLADIEAGVDGWMRLAESRRREYRRRPIGKEFRLTTPTTNIPANSPALSMRADGTVS